MISANVLLKTEDIYHYNIHDIYFLHQSTVNCVFNCSGLLLSTGVSDY
jgi:hypothetical protein